MKIAAHPLIVAVALGLLNPSALAEVKGNDEDDARTQRAQLDSKTNKRSISEASVASLEAQQSAELESVLDELNRTLGEASFDS